MVLLSIWEYVRFYNNSVKMDSVCINSVKDPIIITFMAD